MCRSRSGKISPNERSTISVNRTPQPPEKLEETSDSMVSKCFQEVRQNDLLFSKTEMHRPCRRRGESTSVRLWV